MLTKIKVPGSKSISNRVLILAALAKSEPKIENLAKSSDCEYMIQALKDLKTKTEIYTHNAGTTTRFITALATLLEKPFIIDGDKRMRERPIAELEKALNSLGANVKSTKGCPPVKIATQKPKGGTIALAGDISSQYISAILMIAAATENGVTINIEDELCSKPYVDMTIKIMQQFGIETINNNYKNFKVLPQKITSASQYTIESDASSASYIAAYAALHPNKKVLLENIHRDSIQGDIKFLDYLEKMGCEITSTKIGTIIQGPETLQALGEIDMNATPDLVMTFAVLAAFTTGSSKITNIPNLRIKETDRLQALENELTKLGVKVKIGTDYIEINGDFSNKNTLLNKNIKIKTYDDHRMAMCFAIIRDLIPGLTIEDPECVSKSYQTFWNDLTTLENAK